MQLRKRGLRLRLEEKPSQVLGYLLEEPGQLVSRERLVKLLWPDEAHGDFDKRLNKAVHKLRCTLGDDPTNPRFVQTVNRNGYRFIADVQYASRNGGSRVETGLVEPLNVVAKGHQTTDADSGGSELGLLSGAAILTASTGSQPCSPQEQGDEMGVRGNLKPAFKATLAWLVAAGLVLAAGFSAKVIHSEFQLGKDEHKSVAVLGFTNLSRNPADEWLSSALADWLTSDLTAGGSLRAISKENVARFRSEQGLADIDRINPRALAKMSRGLGSDLVVSGSYASSGTDGQSRMRLDAELRDSHSGRLLASANATGSRAEIFDLAASTGVQLRAKLGLRPIKATGLSSMRSVLPSAPDAGRFYTEATDDLERFDPAGARLLLQRAIALEPEHALSHAALSTADTMLGFSAEARTEAKKALDLSGSIGTEQRLLIEGQYYETNYEWQKAISAYARLFQLFPDSAENGIRLAQAQALAGEPNTALTIVRRLEQLPLASQDRARADIAEAEAAASVSDFPRQRDAGARAADIARRSSATLLFARAEEEEGEAVRSLGNSSQALALWKDAETKYVGIGDRSALARLLIDEGQVRWERGDVKGADADYANAASISNKIGDAGTSGRALTALAQVRMFSVGPAEGSRLCDEALGIFRQIGNKQEEAYTLSVMADIAFADHARAARLYRESLGLSQEVNDRSRTAGRLMDLGKIATVQGNLPAADDYLQQSLRIYHNIGERDREALLLSLLSVVRTWQGRLNEADQLSSQAVAMLSAIGEIVPLAQSRQTLGTVRTLEGRFSDAEAIFNLAIKEHESANNAGGAGIASGQLAEVLLLEGKLSESKAALKGYEDVLRRNRNWQGEQVTQGLIVRARIDAAEEHLAEARTEAARAVNYASSADQGSMAMKARLMLGRIEMQGGKFVSSQRHLEMLARNAHAKGFGLIARDAQDALSRSTTQLRTTSAHPVR